jgi:hypothetical protein
MLLNLDIMYNFQEAFQLETTIESQNNFTIVWCLFCSIVVNYVTVELSYYCH